MDSVNFEKWLSVLDRREPFTWELWSSPSKDSMVLTDAGRKLVDDFTETFSSFFGKDFLDKCIGKDHPFLSFNYSPINDAPPVYLRLIDLYAHIKLLKDQKGMNRLRKIMRTDKSWKGWNHALIQLEIAGLAYRTGGECEFEPEAATGNKADVLVTKFNNIISVETLTMGTDYSFQKATQYFEVIRQYFFAIYFEHSVQIEGAINSVLEGDEFTNFISLVKAVAKEIEGIGGTKRLFTKGADLKISKVHTPSSPIITGIRTQSDEWARIEARIRDKARQTEGMENVWIRMDELGGLWQFTQWATKPLQTKLELISPLILESVNKYPHLSGMVLTNAWGFRSSNDEETCIHDNNVALRRHLLYGRERETLIISKEDECSIWTANEVASWYAEESTWLTWALDRLGLPSILQLIRS